MKKSLNIVVAVDREGGFAKDGKIPWDVPGDMKRFKQLTTNHVCVMGRKTYEDVLDGRNKRDVAKRITDPIDQILKGRDNYVVTTNIENQYPGATKVKGLINVMTKFKPNDTKQIFVIGGLKLFIEALAWEPTIYMSILKREKGYDCDRVFPIQVLEKSYHIVDGSQDSDAYYVTYKHNRLRGGKH